MARTIGGRMVARALALVVACLACVGCHSLQLAHKLGDGEMPRELEMVSLPPYVVEPPDILLIDAIRVVPKGVYHIEPLDVLFVRFPAKQLEKEDLDTVIKNQWDIGGTFTVETDGKVNLGKKHGSVKVVGLTLEEAQKVVLDRVRNQTKLADAGDVGVEVVETRGLQQIRGEHLVRPDGTVHLGTYGSVYVAGLSLAATKAAIELHLAQSLYNPEVTVDVLGYNSKVYHVIMNLAASGLTVQQFPVTGNETVLTAIGLMNGLPPTAVRNHMWIARPAPGGMGCEQILPVDWVGISERGSAATNYQLLPGDRLYVQADPLWSIDNALTKIITPLERVLGFTLLGNATLRALQQGSGAFNQGGGGFGGF